METMSDYTIFCTREQTYKAIELGAPITKDAGAGFRYEEFPNPTAEQMIGWLRGKGVSAKANALSWDDEHNYAPFFQVHEIKSRRELLFGWRKSYEEATLAAIDAALDYLEQQTKQ